MNVCKIPTEKGFTNTPLYICRNLRFVTQKVLCFFNILPFSQYGTV